MVISLRLIPGRWSAGALQLIRYYLHGLLRKQYIMRGSDYAELRAFATIAEHGSFARAASQLGVSPSALSQTIRGLEERLGIRLLNRTTRSVAPSEAGARLLAPLLPALADFDAAIPHVRSLRDA